MLDPGGEAARAILDLGWVLFVGAGLILVGVMAVALWAVVARPNRFPGGERWVTLGGIAFPVVVLSALLVHEFGVARRLVAPAGDEPLRIEVVGRQWWWEVRYPDAPSPFRTANELRPTNW